MSANMKKIATQANVSLATVSKAFSGSKEISQETREKVFKVAKQLNCYDKYNQTKTLKKVIGIVCPEIISEYYTSLISNLQNKIEKRGGISIISVSDFNKEKLSEMVSYYSSDKTISGIILLELPTSFNKFADKPVVLLSTENLQKSKYLP